MVQLGVLLAIGAVVWFLAERANELFAISVRDGRAMVVRGRVPPALLEDLAMVVGEAKVARGSIRALRAAEHARLAMRGIDDGPAQRLRNIFGIHPLRQLSAAPLAADRNLGQILGIAWLAWFLSDLTRR